METDKGWCFNWAEQSIPKTDKGCSKRCKTLQRMPSYYRKS